MELELGRHVLLFFEDRDRDTFVRGDRNVRRRLRHASYLLRPWKQRVSGFEMSFRLLVRALREAGQTVLIDDFRAARRNPGFPVGMCGYVHILDSWDLPNPAVLGPGLLDHPTQAPKLMDDPRFRSFLMLCDWMRDMFATGYDPQKLPLWFGGIDLDAWPDTRDNAKDIDVLVYDKIRWNRDHLVPQLLEPILATLEARGLTVETVRYGRYTHQTYRALLGRSRSMLFLCEHETQGMAYQEALASNVPVLAWDQGTWLDPHRAEYAAMAVPATSVPYFAKACGATFADVAAFAQAFDGFYAGLDDLAPRSWIAENLSFARSARLYLRAYLAAASAGTESARPA